LCGKLLYVSGLLNQAFSDPLAAHRSGALEFLKRGYQALSISRTKIPGLDTPLVRRLQSANIAVGSFPKQ
jgi:hypothetical protein